MKRQKAPFQEATRERRATADGHKNDVGPCVEASKLIEGFANGQDMSENCQRASAATRNAIKLLAASTMLGGQGVDAAIDRAAIGVAGETYVRAEHSRQKMVALGALRRLAPIDDFAA